jgi:quercetin dioxygenase-like cupin family protein
MASTIKKSLNKADDIQSPDKMKVESVTLNGRTVRRITAEPGWKWSKHLQPVVGGRSCQNHHFIFMISGTMFVKMDDGQEMKFNPGDVGMIPPGHDGWNSGKEPMIWLEIPD